METPCRPLDLAAIGRLDFELPDVDRFPALRLARAAVEAGGAAPIVLNAANEIAVAAFLAGQIGFLEIAMIVEDVIARKAYDAPHAIEDVWAIDETARRDAVKVAEEMAV